MNKQIEEAMAQRKRIIEKLFEGQIQSMPCRTWFLTCHRKLTASCSTSALLSGRSASFHLSRTRLLKADLSQPMFPQLSFNFLDTDFKKTPRPRIQRSFHRRLPKLPSFRTISHIHKKPCSDIFLKMPSSFMSKRSNGLTHRISSYLTTMLLLLFKPRTSSNISQDFKRPLSCLTNHLHSKSFQVLSNILRPIQSSW